MTGWVSRGAACIVCDSAVTGPSVGDDESIFGEQTASFGRYRAQEGAAKLIRRGDAVVGLVGRLSEAMAFAQQISPVFGETDIKRLVGEAARHAQTRDAPPFELLIARHQAGEPQLWRFRSSKEYLARVSGRCVLGSAASDPDFLALVTQSMKSADRSIAFSDDQLAMCAATVRGVGMATSLLELGIGGAIYGAYVSEKGVYWSSDTAYACCTRRLVEPVATFDDDSAPMAAELGIRVVGVAVRDGYVARWSNYNGARVEVLTPPEADDVATKLWSDRWSKDLNQLPYMESIRYWTFLIDDIPGHLTVDVHNVEAGHYIDLLEGNVAVNDVVGDLLRDIVVANGGFHLISRRYEKSSDRG